MATAEKKTGFDLSTLETADTTTVDILHPTTGEPIGATATIHGQDSEVYRKAKRRADQKFTEYARKSRGKFMPPEEREQLDLDVDIAAVKSIDGLSYKGAPLEDVADIFTRFPFIREQIGAAITDRANFIKG